MVSLYSFVTLNMLVSLEVDLFNRPVCSLRPSQHSSSKAIRDCRSIQVIRLSLCLPKCHNNLLASRTAPSCLHHLPSVTRHPTCLQPSGLISYGSSAWLSA